MGAHAKVPCVRCAQEMDVTCAACPTCGAPHELVSGPSQVPPALAIAVALALLLGIASLIVLLNRAAAPHGTPRVETTESPAAPPTPSAAASPSPAPVATPSAAAPRAATSPAPKLPAGPAPGQAPQAIGMPPAPIPSLGGPREGSGPRYPDFTGK